MSFWNRRGLKGERLSVVSVEADVQCGRVKSETNLDGKIKWLTWFYTLLDHKKILQVFAGIVQIDDLGDYSQKGQLCEECSYFFS